MSSADFQDKSVIVTGASSGIGEAIAVLLARRGARVTLCGRDEARLENVREQCQTASGGHPERFITVCGDVNDQSVRQKIVDDTMAAFGRLDVLVPNAGVGPPSQIATDTEETFDFIMNTNLKSVYFLIQLSLPLLEKTKGNIVCTSSIFSTTVTPRNEIYHMSKAALDHLVRSLALSQGPKGIRVNCINPTYVPTRITRHIPGEILELAKQRLEQFAANHPLHGRASTAEEQAEVVAFLASDRAGFVTGECVKVDGGFTLGSRP